MIKKFKIFEKTQKPDLRKIGEYVKCIETIPKSFKEDNFYKVDGIYGDPHRAIEEFNMNNYVPVECISKVMIIDDKGRKREFFVNKDYYKNAGFDIYSQNFFEYFEIQEFEQKKDKYNL